MHDDIITNKIAVLERCLARVREEYRNDPARLQNFTIQDAIVLNLQRACETAIDLAMHVIATLRLGVPQDARDAFAILRDRQIISPEIARTMQNMVGFRNIAVHDYQSLRIAVLDSILTQHLDDFTTLCAALVNYAAPTSAANGGNH